MKIKIENDVFNIAKRLKSHNKSYFILYNTKTKKFELHSSLYKNSLCLVFPFTGLDCRAINYVLKNERVEETIKEIEENNFKIELSKKNNQTDRAKYQLNEIYKYANMHCKDFDGQAFKDTWI